MRKLLLQLDSSRLPSVFDQVVAYDAAADVVMSYGGVTEGDVRDLIHGCIFTRSPKDLRNTAVWIGGNNMSAGEQLLAMAQDAARGTLEPRIAERAIAIAALVNTAAKAVLAASLGGAAMLRSASLILGLALAAGAATAVLTL